MFLIEKGKEPRPVCVACKKADWPGAPQLYEQHVCAVCLSKLKAGKGLNIEPTRKTAARAM